MKIEQQVCSLEISKRLKELGVKQESLFVHTRMRTTDPYQVTTLSEAGEWKYYDFENTYSAFTVAELGEMLPDSISFEEKLYVINIYKLGNEWIVEFEDNENELKTHTSYQADTEADARGKMLIYLFENNLI